MAGTIDVSVVVPCYNTEKFLDQCLKSIEADRGASIEIIVLNDGSTDGSLDIMRKHEAKDDRIHVIDKPNQGYGASVNRGINEARGTYIAIVEPDDYLMPGMYTAMMKLAAQYDEPDMIRSSYWRVWMPETSQEKLFHCSYFGRIKPSRQPFTLKDCPRIIQHHPSIWAAVYKRSFLDEFGIRFMEVPGAGWVDNPFLIETSAQARSIAYTDEPFYCYREDLPGSSSSMRARTLSFERWNNMADIVERLGITDKGILEALYVIGFRYVGGAIDEGAFEDPEMIGLVTQMFRRMDPSIVADMANLSTGFKKTYFRLSGFPTQKLARLPYLKSLVNEFAYSWKSNGAAFAFSRVAAYVKNRLSDKGAVDPTKTRSASI